MTPAELALAPLGLVAGALTTLAGLGGGLLLVASLSILFDPVTALVLTAPALLLGNLHRTFVYRAHLDREILVRLVPMAFASALAFSVLSLRMPERVLQLLLVGATTLALLRATGRLSFTVPRAAIPVMGAVVGAVTATSGGGPALLAPTLLSLGLRGERYVSTGSATALSMHVGRVLAYGGAGAFGVAHAPRVALLAAAVLLGNQLGVRLRPSLSDRTLERLELAAIVVVLGVSVAALG